MAPENWIFGVFLLPLLVGKLDGSGGEHGQVKVRHHRNLENRVEPHLRHQKGQEEGVSKSELVTRSELVSTDENVFKSDNNTDVLAHIGSTVSLLCQVKKDVQYGVITWARQEDSSRPYTLLTVGDSSYIEDLRYSIEKPIRHDTWNMRIKGVKMEDNGIFECQATTHPPQSILVKLVVVEAYAEIIGTKEKVFKSDENLQLICALRQATAKPDYIFWFHNDRMINYDVDRGISVKENENGSILTISSVSVSDSGNYTCSPSQMRPDSVTVTILSESKSANALQDKAAAASGRLYPPSYLNLILPVTQLFLTALLEALQDSFWRTIMY